jgi:GT2 family glycosyltransferase
MVTHQGRELPVQALRSAHARTGAIDVEWLLVDSGSTDGTPELLEAAFPELVVSRLANVGFAAANNSIIARARGRWLLLLNPDMEIVEGTLAELVAALDARPEIGAASVIQQWPDGRVQETIRRFPSPSRQLGEALWLARVPGLSVLSEEERHPAAYRAERSADWLVGGFLVVRRKAVEVTGGLDERFFLFSEETDWCLRLRAAGWDVRHLPVMTVTHHTGRMARPDLFAQNSHSKLLYARKHFGLVRRATFRTALAARHALRMLLLLPVAAARPGLRPRLEAERRALLVVLGWSAPPFRPVASGSPSPS